MFFKNLDYAAGWLAGMIDGEGNVANPSKLISPGGHKIPRRVSICNTDLTIIETAEKLLKIFGIEYFKQTVRHENPKWSTTYNLFIQKRSSMMRLSSLIELASSRKQQFLYEHMAYYKSKDAKAADRRCKIAKAYIQDQSSIKDISKSLKMGPLEVRRELINQGIPIRSLSDSMTIYWNRKKGCDPVEDSEIVAYYNPPEISVRDVARHFCITRTIVKRVLRRNGVAIMQLTQPQISAKIWESRRRNLAQNQPCLPLTN